MLPESVDARNKYIKEKEVRTPKALMTKLGLPTMSYSFEVICDYSSFGSAKVSIEKVRDSV